MQKMIPRKDIVDLFNIFHDGGIVFANQTKKSVFLRVEIPYLTARIKKGYKYFEIVLNEARDFSFNGWLSDADKSTKLVECFDDIFKDEIEILSATDDGKSIKVTCNIGDVSSPYCGGVLLFICDSAEVKDEGGTEYSIDELDALCRGYWNDWKAKNQTA